MWRQRGRKTETGPPSPGGLNALEQPCLRHSPWAPGEAKTLSGRWRNHFFTFHRRLPLPTAQQSREATAGAEARPAHSRGGDQGWGRSGRHVVEPLHQAQEGHKGGSCMLGGGRLGDHGDSEGQPRPWAVATVATAAGTSGALGQLPGPQLQGSCVLCFGSAQRAVLRS